MRPLWPALLVSLLARGQASAQDMPNIKFQKSEPSKRSGVDSGDGRAANDMLGLQCARVLGRRKSEPCSKDEMEWVYQQSHPDTPKRHSIDPATLGSDLRQKAKDSRVKEVGERQEHLQNCVNTGFDASFDPDSRASILSNICVGAKYEILTYEGKTTDPRSNEGMIQYMRGSLVADCALYNAAVAFYKELKSYDLDSRPAPGHSAGASMEGTAPVNLGVKAQEVVRKTLGRDDPYLAMKVIAVYGHDNKFNYLSVSGCPECGKCQLKVLDALKPNSNSTLYMNEAIGSPIGSDWTTKGVKLFEECRAAAKPSGENWLVEGELCGEYDKHQTGYYHLNAAAFLQCACLAHGQGLVGGAINDLTEALQRDAYMGKVADYKINAVGKLVKKALGDPGHTPATRLLSYAVPDKLEKGMTVEDVDKLPWSSWCADPKNFAPGNCAERHIRFAKATMKFFVHEVRYRMHLHHLGILAGNSYCRGVKKVPPPRCGN